MYWEGVSNQAPLQVKKEYILDLTAPATLGVYFARGPTTGKPVSEPQEDTFYVSFPLPGGSSSSPVAMEDGAAIDSSTHLCGKDVYTARVELRRAQKGGPSGSGSSSTPQQFDFSTKCEVTGPKKNHLIHTDYKYLVR